MIYHEDASRERLQQLVAEATDIAGPLESVLGAELVRSLPDGVVHVFVRLPGGRLLRVASETVVKSDSPRFARPSLVHTAGRARLSGI